MTTMRLAMALVFLAAASVACTSPVQGSMGDAPPTEDAGHDAHRVIYVLPEAGPNMGEATDAGLEAEADTDTAASDGIGTHCAVGDAGASYWCGAPGVQGIAITGLPGCNPDWVCPVGLACAVEFTGSTTPIWGACE